ncbi:MAG TPA: histidine kinase [Bacillota bacterium]|nr:histidine kinase [Bacillota bacterium]
MTTPKPMLNNTIRNKLLASFLLMIATFVLVSLSSYYSEQYLLQRINSLLVNNLKFKQFRTDVDRVVTYLEKYLISRNFNMLREYFRYSQAVDSEYAELTLVKSTRENYLLLENIRNLTRAFLQETEKAVQAKRARNSTQYRLAFVEVSRYRTNIHWAVDRLITQQLEENSRQHLLISQRLHGVQRLGLLLIVGAMVFSVIIMTWISFRLTRPLHKLAEVAQNITRGNFDLPPLKVATPDEVGVVTGAFNEMVSSITRLIAEIRSRSDLEKRLQEQEVRNLSMQNTLREAELHALQSQINPHFLFNMLNAGVQLAVVENAELTADYIDKVSSLLRYNLRCLEVPVTLAEEATNLQNYFYILRTRYGSDRFTFQIEIEPDLAGFSLPLLTLQPIVENALIHGIENLESGGRIEVKAFTEAGRVIIRVFDNGKGMDPQILCQLQTAARAVGHTTGIGLNNVQERLRIFFGEDARLEFTSLTDQGTTVSLNLPGNAVTEGVGTHANFSC